MKHKSFPKIITCSMREKKHSAEGKKNREDITII